MFTSWIKEVLWGNQVRSYWTIGSVTIAVISLPPWGQNLQSFRYAIPLSCLLIGFVISNFSVYRSLKAQLKSVTDELTIGLLEIAAGEHRNVNTQHHSIVIEFLLEIRNKNQHGNTVELRNCCLDSPQSRLEYLMFQGDPRFSIHFPPATTWKVEGKSQTRPVVKCTFLLPLYPEMVESDEIAGILNVTDIHDHQHEIKFSAQLIRNEPVTLEY